MLDGGAPARWSAIPMILISGTPTKMPKNLTLSGTTAKMAHPKVCANTPQKINREVID